MTSERPTLTHERLQAILNYDPATGIFTWRTSPHGRFPVGTRAGGLQFKGYRSIKINARLYRCNRLAWLYMTGEWPTHQIDHIDGNKDNDAFNNLREATNAQNQWNTRVQRNNKTGIKGVRWNARLGKYTADIRLNGKSKHIGVFSTIEEARVAYNKVAAEHHGEFVRLA